MPCRGETENTTLAPCLKEFKHHSISFVWSELLKTTFDESRSSELAFKSTWHHIKRIQHHGRYSFLLFYLYLLPLPIFFVLTALFFLHPFLLMKHQNICFVWESSNWASLNPFPRRSTWTPLPSRSTMPLILPASLTPPSPALDLCEYWAWHQSRPRLPFQPHLLHKPLHQLTRSTSQVPSQAALCLESFPPGRRLPRFHPSEPSSAPPTPPQAFPSCLSS